MTTPTTPMPYDRSLTHEIAARVLAAAVAEAGRNGWPMSIAIVDTAADLVAFARMDDAQTGSIDAAHAKARTAALYKRPSKVFEDAVTAGGQGLRLLGMPNLCPVEGGWPIVRDGRVLGAIGVSGMRADQDTVVANAGLAAL
jgi:uncharacterized protein GlcG (DUF336 family)